MSLMPPGGTVAVLAVWRFVQQASVTWRAVLAFVLATGAIPATPASDASHREELTMTDFLLVIAVIGFFALCWAYVAACDRM